MIFALKVGSSGWWMHIMPAVTVEAIWDTSLRRIMAEAVETLDRDRWPEEREREYASIVGETIQTWISARA